MTKMDKQYIEKEYDQAIKEYNAALTEDDLDTARRTMKRLEAIAMQDYGFNYADKLAMKKKIVRNFRGYGILPMILGFGSIPTSSICRLSDK